MSLKTKLQVLVVAPQFPSVNQAWIDNYLQQLDKNSIDFFIYTTRRDARDKAQNNQNSNYANKITHFNLKRSSLMSTVIKSFLFDIRTFLRVANQAKNISEYLHENYKLNTFKVFVFLLYFGVSDVESLNAGIIHSHDETSAYYFMLCALIKRKPLIHTFHGLLPPGVNSLSYKKRQALYNEIHQVLVNTNFARRQVMDRGCPEYKVCIVPQGLPLEKFPFHPLPCPEKETLHLLTVGRFHRDKGHGYALLAIKRLIQAGVNVKYTIVGVGPERYRLHDFIKMLGIESNVSLYVGIEFNELLEIYKNTHIFLLPSINNNRGIHVETQGVVLQEAQAVGTIPIATNVGGIPECLNHLQDSIVVKDKSSRAISNAVYHLMNNPELWPELQKNGRRNVEKRYSSDVIGGKLASILYNTINKYESCSVN